MSENQSIFSVEDTKEALDSIFLAIKIRRNQESQEGVISKMTTDKAISYFLKNERIGSSNYELEMIKPFYKNGESLEKGNLPAGYIIKQDNKVTISYRGTDSIWEGLHDAQINRTPMKFGQDSVLIHSGFKKEFELSKANRDKVIQSLNIGDLPITVTGHSMGAALAQIAALDFATNEKKSVKVITFGGPRVFGNAGAKLYNKIIGERTLRVKNSGDIVTRIPPKGMYAHAGLHKITVDTKEGMHLPDHYQDAVTRVTQEQLNVSHQKAAERKETLMTPPRSKSSFSSYVNSVSTLTSSTFNSLISRVRSRSESSAQVSTTVSGLGSLTPNITPKAHNTSKQRSFSI